MKKHEEESEREAKRLVDLLTRLIRLSGRSLRSLEEELGLGSSVLSKILNGVIRPQLGYVLMICSALGVPPAQFFRLAYPDAGPAGPLVEQFLEAEGRKRLEKEEKAPDDLDARVREALFRVLDELRERKA